MRIAVIGSGTMGLGIAAAFSMTKGYQVHICIEDGKNQEEEKTRFLSPLKKMVEKGKMEPAEYDRIETDIQLGSIKLASSCDLVVESVFEDFQCKSDVLMELDRICKKSTIITTNTSSLSIGKLEEKLSRPLIGMHFFNPASIMKLVEIIRGEKVLEEQVQEVIRIAKDIGKVPVDVKDAPGFVVNRILIPMINESVGVLAEGVSSVQGIDEAMKYGANFPLGPLALGDLIGLDVCLAIMNVIYNETNEEKYRPHPLLLKMVEEGTLGKKTGRGFYKYG